MIMKGDPKAKFTLVFIDYFPQSANLIDNRNEALFDSIIFEFRGTKKNETASICSFCSESTSSPTRRSVEDIRTFECCFNITQPIICQGNHFRQRISASPPRVYSQVTDYFQFQVPACFCLWFL
uniref:Uncharacterized protein n=1 Tax=Romanomermis culicivorax TaxID=13658 RepID=A0A915I6T0_ROMCU